VRGAVVLEEEWLGQFFWEEARGSVPPEASMGWRLLWVEFTSVFNLFYYA